MAKFGNERKDTVEPNVGVKKLPVLPEVGLQRTVEEQQARKAKMAADFHKAVWEMDSKEEDDREKNPLKYVKRLLKGFGYKEDAVDKVLADNDNPYRVRLDEFVRSTFARALVPDASLSKEKGYPVFLEKEVEVPKLPQQYIDRGVVQALNFRSRVEKDLRRVTSDFDYEFVLNVAASKSSKALDDYTFALAVGKGMSFELKRKVVEELQKLFDNEKALGKATDAEIKGGTFEMTLEQKAEMTRQRQEAEARGIEMSQASDEYMQTYMKDEVAEMASLAESKAKLDAQEEAGQEVSHEDYISVGAGFDKAIKDFAGKNPQYAESLQKGNDVINTYLNMKANGVSDKVAGAYLDASGLEELFDEESKRAYDLYSTTGDASGIAALHHIENLLEGKIDSMNGEYLNDKGDQEQQE